MLCLTHETPPAWAHQALENIPALLSDHLSCEFKAAQAARAIRLKWGERYPAIAAKMSALSMEEEAHCKLVERMRSEFIPLAPPPGHQPYTAQMRRLAGRDGGNPVDLLLVSGLIEARSCERFWLLATHATGGLKSFYEDFFAAEARHHALFVQLARDCFGDASVDKRLPQLAAEEAKISAGMPLRPSMH
jgi:tRNA-(ms[2]io[6]A)-hydroxylase